jgi:hypothetical protein
MTPTHFDDRGRTVQESVNAWRQRIQDEANAKRSEAAKAQHAVSNPRAGEKMDRPQRVDEPERVDEPAKSAPRGKGTAAKAAASKTDRGTVERMDALAQKRPDLAAEVKAAGDMAQGTRGQLVGREASGGQCRVPPEKKAPTLADLGVSATEVAAEILRRRPKPHPRRHTNERNTPGVSRDGE